MGIQEIFVLLIFIIAVLILPRYFSRGKTADNTSPLPKRHLSEWTGRMRLAVVASILWPVSAALYFKPWDGYLLSFICLGPGPVLLAWGAYWVINGFRRHRR